MKTKCSWMAGWVGMMLVLALSTPGAGIGLPTLVSIVIDGDASDWVTVLANPVNVTQDGDGSSYGRDCIGSTDRDCEVKGGTGRDLLTFAWTYDSDNIYLLIERWGSTSNIIRFFFVMDLDGNAHAEASDRVLLVEWSGVKATFDAMLYAYVPDPAGSGSDSLVDPSTGFADGWKMPGGIDTASPLATYAAVPGGEAATGLRFEASVSWTDLGLGGPTPINFHVASHNNTTLSEAEDNMGGPDGKLGCFGFTGVDIFPAWIKSVGPGELVSLAHTISNQGNQDGRFDLTGCSSLGLSMAYYTDPDGDGAADDLMAIDANGDGDFSDGADTAPAAAYDTNSDGRPDFSIPVGAQDYFVVEVQVPPFLNAATDYLDFHVELDSIILVEDQVEDQLYIGYFTVFPDRQASAVPGQYIDYGHWVTNNQSFADTADLSVWSSRGWDLALFSDPDGDGDPADGVELARDLGGDGAWDSGDPDTGLLAPAGGSAWYVVRVFVPAAAVVGTDVDVTTFTATSVLNSNRSGTATDVTTVRERLSVEPDYTFIDGTNLYGSVGKSVYFPFRVINSWIAADSFALTAVSAQGWPVVLWSDPNGNGSIDDGSVVANTGMVSAGGGWFDLVAEVQVPITALGGDQDTLTVTATSDLEPGQSDSAIGQLEVHLLQTFRDNLYLFQARYFATCETIYARATGLAAGEATRYTIRYRDSTMSLIDESALITNARGFADASRVVTAGEPLGTWTLEVWDTDSSSVLDFVSVDHERTGAVGPVAVSPDPAAAGNPLQVSAAYTNTNSAAPYSQTVATTWVHAPDGSVLQDDGTFVPDTGVEVTQIRSIPPLAAGDSAVDIFTVTDVAFPAIGTYTVDIRWDTGCGDVIATLAPSVSFQVDADTDLDGVPDSIDICPTGYNPMQDLLADPLACGQCDIACADLVECTDDVCQAGVCANLPNDLNCPDDGQFCNGTEYCDATSGCASTGDPCAATGQVCNETDDTCGCTSDADCDDGLWCNGAETCTGGACSPGMDPCPGQMCDESGDVCVVCLQDADCDDGLYCTGAETCDLGTGECLPGEDPCPDKACNEDDDVCEDCTTDADCDDGRFCNGVETCDPETGNCLPGEARCGPEQVCDEDNDTCWECETDRNCDDGIYCNGAEACVGGKCRPGEYPCDDGIDCTVDACDEEQDACDFIPDDFACDDGDECTQDACDSAAGCDNRWIDSDGDGVCNAEDPCPYDRDDDCIACRDSDEDGECDEADPCPYDSENQCTMWASGVPRGGGCDCSTAESPVGSGFLLLLVFGWFRRRRR
jgi:uncharacterized protein (TIGR03382 family)